MAQLTTGALLVFLIIAVALVSLPSTTVQSGDVYTVQLTDDALQTLLEVDGVDLVPGVTAETDLETLAPEQTLVEIILTAGSDLIGETIDSAGFSVSFWACRRASDATNRPPTEPTRGSRQHGFGV